MNLSADQIIIQDGTAYVVAEGEHCPKCHSTGELIMPWPDLTRPPCDHPYCAGPGRLSPPAWMTAKCETCGGDFAWAPGFRSTGPFADTCEPCPDCINGKPIHTVEVECRNVIPGGGVCQVCDDDGTISYHLVVREVRQIEASPEPYGPGYPPAAKPEDYLAICEVVT